MDWHVNVLASVPSTQEPVHQAAEDGAREGLVIQAFQQKSGKGRSGHHWDSPMGNLYMSFLLRPSCEPIRMGEMAFVVGLGLSKALDEYIDPDKHKKQLKWPNDVLIDGLKISGILLEIGADNSLVVGMGVNILSSPDLAVSLGQVSSKPVYVNKVRDNILDKIGIFYEQWQKEGFAPVRDLWLNQAYGLNEEMTARLPTEKHKGLFHGIDETGALLLEHPDGSIQTIHAADVHFGEI